MKAQILGLLYLAASAPAPPSSDVVPIAVLRRSGSLPDDPLSRKWQLLLNNNCKEVLAGWWMESQCRGHEGEYIDFGYLERNKKTDDFGVETKGGIRPPSQHVYSLAVALATGAYDASVTGVSREQAVIRAVTIVKSLAKDHVANGGIGRPWGDHWQSAQWASKTAVSGWLLWDHMDARDREYVGKMIEHEANRFLDVVPPAANAQYISDTKAEENGWNAAGIQAACALMPKHPNFAAWRKKAIEYRMTALIWRTPGSTMGARRKLGFPATTWTVLALWETTAPILTRPIWSRPSAISLRGRCTLPWPASPCPTRIALTAT